MAMILVDVFLMKTKFGYFWLSVMTLCMSTWLKLVSYQCHGNILIPFILFRWSLHACYCHANCSIATKYMAGYNLSEYFETNILNILKYSTMTGNTLTPKHEEEKDKNEHVRGILIPKRIADNCVTRMIFNQRYLIIKSNCSFGN